jgi:hypothetical protein
LHIFQVAQFKKENILGGIELLSTLAKNLSLNQVYFVADGIEVTQVIYGL